VISASRISRRRASATALKTSDVVEARATVNHIPLSTYFKPFEMAEELAGRVVTLSEVLCGIEPETGKNVLRTERLRSGRPETTREPVRPHVPCRGTTCTQRASRTPDSGASTVDLSFIEGED
jgi:hypothetical protein